ncbi:MAG: hypothetical protein Q8928_08295 [Bacteroidota bacterium]|nr:hypothetical protein [Bacteroidota bacterium]
MKDLFQQTIEMMRQHVLENLKLIKANEAEIRKTLSFPESMERTNELSHYYNQNKSLLIENNDFINLQVSIVNLMNKHQQTIDKSPRVQTQTVTIPEQILTRDDYFRLTIEENLAYDHRHPYFNDSEFYNDLINYLKIEENYELCAKLVSVKKQLI